MSFFGSQFRPLCSRPYQAGKNAMTQQASPPHVARGDSGAILSFALVFSLILIVMAGAYVVNSLVVRQAKTDLDYYAYRACFLAAQQLPSYGNAAQVFTAQIQQIPLDVTRSRLILLAGTETEFGELGPGGTTLPWGAPGVIMPSASHTYCEPNGANRASILPASNSTCGTNCEVIFDSCFEDVGFSMEENFPPHLFDNQRNSGNTVACFVEARSGFFRFPGIDAQALNVRASVAWGKKLRGSQPFIPGDETTLPRVVLAVAPQLNIPTVSSSYPSSNPNNSRFLNTDRGLEEWFGFRESTGVNFEALLQADAFGDGDPAIPVWGITGIDSVALASLDIDNDQQLRTDLLAGCANMASVARNILSSSLASLLARDGLLRRATEIVLVNSSFVTADEDNFIELAGGNVSVPPTLIVPFGQDIAELNYQLPYATYYLDNYLGNTGFANPFYQTTGTPTAATTEQSRLVSQLKVCQHLYDTIEPQNPQDPLDFSNSLAPAFTNFSPDEAWGEYNFLNFWSNLPRIEPFELFQLSPSLLGKSAQDFDPPIYGPNGTPFFSDACPWNTQEAQCIGAGVNPGHRFYRRLNGIEVLSSLGSLQNCPSSTLGCTKPTLLSHQSYSAPNLQGLFRYLFSSDGQPVSAIRPPGIFPNNSGGIDGSLAQGPYQGAFKTASPHLNADSGTVVLITHGGFESGLAGNPSCDGNAPVNWPLQVQAVRTLVDQRPNWRFIVLFLPTDDLQEQALPCLQRAFDVEDIEDMSNSRSIILHLSPRAAEFVNTQTQTGCPDYNSGNQEQDYRNYWQDLLTPGAPTAGCSQNIVQTAVEIYTQAMLTTELLF